jgi:Flp pilus assembly pilin Flp
MLTSMFINTIWLRHHVVDIVRGRAKGDRGAGLVEYALLLACIVVVCIAAITLLGTSNEASAADSAAKISGAN